MAITLSHGGPTIHASKAPSTEAMVGTTKGVVTIQREGKGWREVRRSLADLHVHALLIEPGSGLVLAGTNGDGIYASEDGGKSWAHRDSGLTEKLVYSLQAARIDGKVRLFAGTEPAKLFISDDAGMHWSESPSLRAVPSVSSSSFPAPPHQGHLKNITFDPRDAHVVYGGVEQGGLLKSIDGGINWSELCMFEEAAGDVHRVLIDPITPSRIWVPTGSGLYASLDAGKTWERRTDRQSAVGGYPDGLVFNPRQPDVLFMSASEQGPGSWRTSHFAGSRIARSKDGGRTWERLAGGLPDRMQAAIEAMCLEDNGKTCTILAGTTAGEVWESDDLGDTWTCAVTGLAPVSKGGHFRNLAVAGHALHP